ncbi:glycosyltransferase family 4 protein [Otoolea muris]|uniref:glycosyltransferase family 4 protein n=1 Tax=Otoolea muris TaxID=2941515 RepID=UPI002040302A|nr:glycosyltransferase family 4 protein [Otoolea muris]
MKILILANSDVGLYRFRKELLQKLLEEEHHVFIALPGGEKVIRMVQMGCAFIRTEIDRRGINPANDIALLKKYVHIIRTTDPDIVLTYTIKPNIYGGIACRILKKRYIANITGLGSALEKSGIIKWIAVFLYRLALKEASCIFFQNAANQKKMHAFGIKGKREVRIPGSGVNTDEHPFEAYPDKSESVEFLFIGRIMKEKGIEELMNAAEYVKISCPDIRFTVAGECEEDYQGRLEEAQQKGILTYLGFRDDVHTLIKGCSAVVLPSYHEGMSNVLLEASSGGRPVLASRIPGCAEVFEDGATGIGFEAKNVESLKKAFLTFISLPYEKKKEMGLRARKRMEDRFDRAAVIQAYMEEIRRAGKEGKDELI